MILFNGIIKWIHSGFAVFVIQSLSTELLTSAAAILVHCAKMAEFIFDPMLTYVASVRNASTVANMKMMLLAKFTASQVKDARAALWDKYPDVLGEPPDRRDGKYRIANEAIVEDILEAFSKLEVAGCLPTFAVRSEQLHLVPRARPEEIDVFSLADRVNALEEALSVLKGAVPPNTAARWTSGNSEVVPPPMSERSSSRLKTSGISSIWDDEQFTRPRSSSRGSVAAPKEVQKKTMAEVTAQNADVQYTLVTKKKKKPKRGQQGTASDKGSLKGGSETFCVQLTNVNPVITETDIEKFVADSDIEQEIKVEDATTPGWPTKRFRVTFPRTVYDVVMKVEFWPANVYFKQFFKPRGTVRRNSDHHG